MTHQLSAAIFLSLVATIATSRLWLNPPLLLTDAGTVLLISAIRHHDLVFAVSVSSVRTIGFNNALLVVCFTAAAILLRLCWKHGTAINLNRGIEPETPIKNPRLKPMLFPCKTTHTRLSPKNHSFSYCFLYAGIPVGWKGEARTLLSADSSAAKRQRGQSLMSGTWFSVEAEDYLGKGSNPDGLKGKLHCYLWAQGVDPSSYPYVYLVTAPRFLGYSFNPVSFWYLYSEDMHLKAMILEVNNTFDERRIYLLDLSSRQFSPGGMNSLFKSRWPKDFHVSPFNSRDGSYSVTAVDPFLANQDEGVEVDVNIVLHDPGGAAKIVARVFSTRPPVVAEMTSRWKAVSFVLRWWWVGLMTSPRILREARKLWSKGLTVFYRPEVLPGSIGRSETTEERVVENGFSHLLQLCATKTEQPVQYTAAAGPKTGVVQQFGPKPSPRRTELIITALTPALYAELVRIGDPYTAIKFFGVVKPETERMVYVSDLGLCKTLLNINLGEPPQARTHSRWSALAIVRAFRNSRSWAEFARSVQKGGLSKHFSSFDHSMLLKSPERSAYMKSALILLISDFVAFGCPGLLKIVGLIMWLGSCALASILLDQLTPSRGTWEASRALPTECR